MTEIVGGLRSRFLFDSFYLMLDESVGALGWYTESNKRRAFTFAPKAQKWSERVRPNTFGLDVAETEDEEAELGSDLSIVTTPFFVGIYAESESVGLDITGDIRDILRGRHPSIGRDRSSFDILNFDQATPSAIGIARISEVNDSRMPTHMPRAWLRHWYTVTCNVTDYYTNDEA